MNMTARILTGLIAVLLGLPAALSFAQPVPNDQSPVYDKTGTGQTGPRFDDRRQRADDLLQRAGTLMDRGDLDGAKQLIGEAEALNPEYPLFYTGPTPRKLRRELEQRLQGSGRAPAPPGPLGIGGSRRGLRPIRSRLGAAAIRRPIPRRWRSTALVRLANRWNGATCRRR